MKLNNIAIMCIQNDIIKGTFISFLPYLLIIKIKTDA